MISQQKSGDLNLNNYFNTLSKNSHQLWTMFDHYDVPLSHFRSRYKANILNEAF